MTSTETTDSSTTTDATGPSTLGGAAPAGTAGRGRAELRLPADQCCPALLDGTLDEAGATDLASVLKALADPVRLRLVSIIAANGEMCVCDLPELVDRRQPTVSHHLSVLTQAGLLDREQRGKWAWFTVQPQRLQALCAALGSPPELCAPRGEAPGDEGDLRSAVARPASGAAG